MAPGTVKIQLAGLVDVRSENGPQTLAKTAIAD